MVPQIEVKLEPVEGRPAELLDAALREAEAGASPVALTRAARLLQQKVLFLAVLSGTEEMITVQIYTFDATRNQSSTRATATISSQDPEQESDRLVASLITFLHPPRVARRIEPAPATGWFGRFRRSRLFWPAVGVGAAIVAASVGVGIYYGTQERPDRRRQLLILPAVPLGR